MTPYTIDFDISKMLSWVVSYFITRRYQSLCEHPHFTDTEIKDQSGVNIYTAKFESRNLN